MKIGLITSLDDPELCSDDRLVLPELKKLGIEAHPFIWDNRKDFEHFDAFIFRSCWNYHRKYSEFLNWLNLLENSGVKVLNPIPVSRWNLHKKYLLELKQMNFPVPETLLIPQGEVPADLKIPASRIVVKPAISLNGLETTLRNSSDMKGIETDLRIILRDRDALLQAFVPEIQSFGEVSLIFFNGIFSHAVRKVSASGEFRVHQEYGGSRLPYSPEGHILEGAEKLISLKPDLLYSRVDMAIVGDSYQLIEWEIIDPMLYLGSFPDASRKFAEAINDRLTDPALR